jgi:competence protein ComEC
VIRIQSAGRTVLLTGDIQDEAIATLFNTGGEFDLTADILELPHHGGYREAAVQFVMRVDPSVVMQSASRSRWRGDRWASILADRERLITARDGACWVQVDEGGAISVGRFLHRDEGDGSR